MGFGPCPSARPATLPKKGCGNLRVSMQWVSDPELARSLSPGGAPSSGHARLQCSWQVSKPQVRMLLAMREGGAQEQRCLQVS